MKQRYFDFLNNYKYLPDFLCISIVVICTTLIPRFYNQIPLIWLRVILTLLAAFVILSGSLFVLYRMFIRNKNEQPFRKVRSVVFAGITLLIICVFSRWLADLWMRTGKSEAYALDTLSIDWLELLNSIVFAIASQVLLTCVSGGREEDVPFVIRCLKASLYVGLPLAVISFLSMRFVSKVLVLRVIVTAILWILAVWGNEQISGNAPAFVLRMKRMK